MTVVKNCLYGLGKLDLAEPIQVKLIAGEYNGNFKNFEKVRFPMEIAHDPAITPEKIQRSIEDATRDCDVIVIENPLVGSRPHATIAFKQFSEGIAKKRGQKVVWHHHDFIDDRPHLYDSFREIVGEFETNEAYAIGDNIIHTTLTTQDQRRLQNKGVEAVVLRNSVIIDDLYQDQEGARRLRQTLEKKKFIHPGEKVILYPVRVVERKNCEEAFLLQRVLEESGQDYRLIITAPHKQDYQRKLQDLAKKHKVKVSVGDVSEHIPNIRAALTMANLAVTTSVEEGFGYVFVEPPLTGTPMIGRDIPKSTRDLKEAGLNLNNLYSDSDYHADPDPKIRIKNIEDIISDPGAIRKIARKLNLGQRIEYAMDNLDNNAQAVRANYGSEAVAKKFYDLITA